MFALPILRLQNNFTLHSERNQKIIDSLLTVYPFPRDVIDHIMGNNISLNLNLYYYIFLDEITNPLEMGSISINHKPWVEPSFVPLLREDLVSGTERGFKLKFRAPLKIPINGSWRTQQELRIMVIPQLGPYSLQYVDIVFQRGLQELPHQEYQEVIEPQENILENERILEEEVDVGLEQPETLNISDLDEENLDGLHEIEFEILRDFQFNDQENLGVPIHEFEEEVDETLNTSDFAEENLDGLHEIEFEIPRDFQFNDQENLDGLFHELDFQFEH